LYGHSWASAVNPGFSIIFVAAKPRKFTRDPRLMSKENL